MSHQRMIGPMGNDRLAGSTHVRKRAARREGTRSRPRYALRLEQLETRVTPSINPASPFELDGNVLTTSTHDWDQVFANTSGALVASFVTDAVNTTADDIFTGGGSKDTQGIQQGQWLFTGSKPQGKNDITHAYAAAYIDPTNGHLLLYAGLDRFDNSGDATAGFWFFKNTIGQNPDVTTNGGHPFVGTHTDGDILLVSDFTIGGSTSTIKVFRWTGNDSTGGLVALNNGNPINGDTFAIVNGAPISVPWSYTNKSGASSPAPGEFLEEGVDLTALGLQGCFSSFLAETRSSQSPTATLSDFAIGSFPLCSLAATPFTGLSKVGDAVTYPLTVQNTGASPLFIQSVSETLLGNIVVNHTLQQPGAPGVNPFVTTINAGGYDFNQPLPSGATLTIFVTRTVQPGDPDPTTSTVTFIGTDDLAGQDDPITASAANSVNLFQPSTTLTVSASPTVAQHLGDPITYTYTVTNTSSADSPNLVLSTSDPNNFFTDTLLGNLEPDAIAAGGGNVAPGGSFTFTKTRAIQSGDPNPLVNTATVAFTLAQNLGNFDNVISAQASASVTLVPHLQIVKAVTPGSPDVIHPGDTASFTITVTNDGAGPATNVLVTDQLPEPDLLTWIVASSTFDVCSLSSGDLLTCSSASLAAGTSAAVTVSAVIPADIFGSTPGPGNGDPLPTGLFELDGDALNDPAVPGDDWSNVLFGNGGSAVAHTFVTDAANSKTDDIYQGGGSKDTLGIQQGQWLFTNSKPQAKDDITHAYAAMYTDPATGDQILYAGLDRFDNSGDATAGFWFLRNAIAENPNVTTNGGHPFIGTHADGDILLVSDFTVGGSVSTIKVFRWTGDDSTGSLVPVATPPNSTFAIVNGASITVPWSFTNKSHETSPAPGEFLEEGVNLSALGLEGCFSSFLAETRSSQSPTATLSDFVLGSFNTCRLDLPNTATVQADGIPPITSNQVIITVVDGHPLQAESIGNGTVSETVTVEQLRPIMAQAIDAWRAAGIDPQRLSALDLVTVHVGNLSRGELGLALPGEIWIDRTAAGWGWSTHGASGRMDLPTVVMHELGHVLGFEHNGTGVMEATLAAGVRSVPEFHTSAGNIGAFAASPDRPGVGAGATARGNPSIFRADDPAGAQPGVGLSLPSRTATIDAAFASAVRDPVGLGQTAAFQNGAMPGTLFSRGPDTVSATTLTPAARGRDRESSSVLVPGVWPPTPFSESYGGNTDVPSDGPQRPKPAAAPANLGEPVRLRSPACDTCFADGSWLADPTDPVTPWPGADDDAGPLPDPATAVALAVFLYGSWGSFRMDSQERTRQRFTI